MNRTQPIRLQNQLTDLHEENWTAKQAMRTKAFWLLMFAGTAGSLIGTALTFHHISIMNSRGIGDTQATLILSLAAGVGVLSTIGTGYLLDKIPNRLLLAVGQIILVATMLWTLAIHDLWQAVIYGILIGLKQGLIYTTMIVIFPNYFGRKYLGSIMGVATIGMVVSSGLGPLPFGALYEYTENYNLAILSFLILPVLCALAALFASPPRHRHI
jgi:MFS family permease